MKSQREFGWAKGYGYQESFSGVSSPWSFKVSWSAVGDVTTSVARKFARDVIRAADYADKQKKKHEQE